MSHTQQDLINALMSAPRFGYRPPPHPLFLSLLRASPPPKPQQPAAEVVARKEPAPAASRGLTAAPEVASLPEVAPVPLWQALLDVTVWRTRPWWLRVAASLVVKRLNR